MAKRIETPLAMELPWVFALENRIVEHKRRADEIDAVLSDILLAARFLPLEHDALSATRPYFGVLLLFGGGMAGWQARRRIT